MMCRGPQESHSSRLDRRRKEAEAAAAMQVEMQQAMKQKEEAALAAEAEAHRKAASARDSGGSTPGLAAIGRRAATPRRPLGL
jgi:Xaa-Pro aminopeptidase